MIPGSDVQAAENHTDGPTLIWIDSTDSILYLQVETHQSVHICTAFTGIFKVKYATLTAMTTKRIDIKIL